MELTISCHRTASNRRVNLYTAVLSYNGPYSSCLVRKIERNCPGKGNILLSICLNSVLQSKQRGCLLMSIPTISSWWYHNKFLTQRYRKIFDVLVPLSVINDDIDLKLASRSNVIFVALKINCDSSIIGTASTALGCVTRCYCMPPKGILIGSIMLTNFS